MLIEIKGTGQGNKGAEMMLLTILRELKKDNIKFVIAPKPGDCEYPFYSKLGLFPKLPVRYKGKNIRFFSKIIPNSILNTFGFITDNNIDVILDASGFSYTSQWGDTPTKNMADDCKRWKSQNKKIILMPQSFGPFKTKVIQKSIIEIIKNVDLIYARDQFSFETLNNLYKSDKIKLAPDFTILFKGLESDHIQKTKNKVCLVPNTRMTDKREDGSKYIDFFINVINILNDLDIESFFLVHAGQEDKNLMNKINDSIDKKIDIIEEDNPYYIKGIIENSYGLIGSRYHSIASALYSEIPVLGTGWSHKYKYLFSEFDYNEGLIDIDISKNDLKQKLVFFSDKYKRNNIIEKLKNNKKVYLDKTNIMFEEVRQCIF